MRFLLLFFLMLSGLVDATRLVVLDPASIEIIYLLGAEDDIAAIATLQQSTIYPVEKTSHLRSVGTFSNPSLERILAIDPDLVILGPFSGRLKASLDELGVSNTSFHGDSLESIKENILALGKLLNKEEAASRLVESFDKQLDELRSNPIGGKAIFFYSSTPLIAFAGDNLINDIFGLLGLENIAAKGGIERPVISAEFLLREDPDVIIYGMGVSDLSSLLRSNPVLAETKAYKSGRVYFFSNPHLLLRPSPRIVENIKLFKRILMGYGT